MQISDSNQVVIGQCYEYTHPIVEIIAAKLSKSAITVAENINLYYLQIQSIQFLDLELEFAVAKKQPSNLMARMKLKACNRPKEKKNMAPCEGCQSRRQKASCTNG